MTTKPKRDYIHIGFVAPHALDAALKTKAKELGFKRSELLRLALHSGLANIEHINKTKREELTIHAALTLQGLGIDYK
jgi:hypothetical protein